MLSSRDPSANHIGAGLDEAPTASPDLASVFDVAVVGAGIMGSCAAYASALRGRSVVLLEALEFGHISGSSHGPSRIVRRTYPSRLYCALMRRSYALWDAASAAGSGAHLLTRVGGGLDIAYRDSAVLAALRAACADAGVALVDVSADEALRRFGLVLRAHEVAVFNADTCIVDASRATASFQRLARERDAALVERFAVASIESSGVHVLRADDGRSVRARRVVVCPGPWAAPLLRRLFGLELNLQVWLCCTMFFEWRREDNREAAAADEEREPLPVLIDYGERPLWTGAGAGPSSPSNNDACDAPIYSCPVPGEGRLAKFGVHRGVLTTAAGRGFAPSAAETVEPVQRWLCARLGHFDAAAPRDATTCLYTMTPDEDFVIDEVPGRPGIFVACGFSGHGFKFGPVVGEMLADLAWGDEGEGGLGREERALAAAAFSMRRPALGLREGVA